MGLQEQIAEAIILAFDELGGDPQKAVNAALRHDTVDSWRQQETVITGAAGGIEMAIPGLHALTIPAGISYLIHKMAYISWGIGALKGNYVVETPQYSDLRNILTLWANASYFNAHIIDHLAISVDAFTYVLTDEGNQTLKQLIANGEDKENVVFNTLRMMDSLTRSFGADERAQEMVRVIANIEMEELVISARDNFSASEPGALDTPLNSRISARLAGRLAARISARVPARLVMGFIPFAGPIVNAIFNAQTLNSMADIAEKYYDNPLRASSLVIES